MPPAGDQDDVELVTVQLHLGHQSVLYTTSCNHSQYIAPEDGRNNRPKHVDLIEIINKIIIASSWLFILLYR